MSEKARILAQLGLMAITPDREDFRSELPSHAARLIQAGVRAISFREKSLDDAEFVALARTCRQEVEAQGGSFVLNERVELAAEIGAKIVHLTFRSPSLSASRQILGNEILIGESTHEIAEVVASEADYVVFGPIFETPSKAGRFQARGLEALRQLEALGVDKPVLALGGMDLEHAPAVFAAGADGLAGIRMFWSQQSLDSAAKLSELWRQSCQRK